MNFHTKLNEYIELLECSSKELSEISKISTSTISRYRNGERIPKYNSNQLKQLVNSLYELATKKGIKNVTKGQIKSDLEKYLTEDNINFENFRINLNIIIERLNINVADISRYMGYDSSYLSKIRSGIRKPQHTSDFINAICKYIINNYSNQKEQICSIINCQMTDIYNQNNYLEILYKWFISKNDEDNTIDDFLLKLDKFDLNEYIQAIHFDELKVPNIPLIMSKSKTYYDLDGLKQVQLDFLKATILSKSTDDVFFFSTFPMEEMAKDNDFSKKWMYGLGLMLKKGIHLNIIHNINRPTKEMLLGLESWIPLYMTNQISPYYFENYNHDLYLHLDAASQNVAITVDAIDGSYKNNKSYLTRKPEEVEFYQSKAKLLLKKAKPLMKIYDENKKEGYYKILDKDYTNYNRHNILPYLPLFTLNDKLIKEIIKNNNINSNEEQKIIAYIKAEKEKIEKNLKEHTIIDEITNINNNTLTFSDLFINKKIKLSKEQLKEHYNLTKEFAKNHKNYILKEGKEVFKNITIKIIIDECIIISKENNPFTHFVIYEPKLRQAIENFKAPVIEEDFKNEE